jgi:hypothetical protein
LNSYTAAAARRTVGSAAWSVVLRGCTT